MFDVHISVFLVSSLTISLSLSLFHEDSILSIINIAILFIIIAATNKVVKPFVQSYLLFHAIPRSS